MIMVAMRMGIEDCLGLTSGRNHLEISWREVKEKVPVDQHA